MGKKLKVIIADVVDPRVSKEKMVYRMKELENLVSTYGGVVIVKKIQKRGKPDYKTFIGKGKLEEIKSIIQQSGADVLILGNILKPFQVYNLNEELKEVKAQAWNRVDLILKIFDLHAKNPEAKLQIELASIKHMGPRIFGMGMELSRQGGGIGTKGIGETNTEIMKRHLRKRIQQIEEKLKQYEKVREQHRKSRNKKKLNTVGLVGYTNAGKSSLLNALTHKGVLAEDKLFATLGTSVGELFLNPYNLGLVEGNECKWNQCKKILLNDTVGFIQDLPPSLIKAFKSTLEDSIESDILFHVVDISDPFILEKINVVNDILDQIGAKQERIYVFNKLDMLENKDIKNYLKEKNIFLGKERENEDDKGIFIPKNKFFIVSSKTGENLDKIKKFLFERF